jgi:hypothetical protein
MSTEEFEREFDILYNNIMSNAAPSIDAYEKSVFLTKAQEEIVTAIYDGSFEHTEKFTECLDVLVVTTTIDTLDAVSVEVGKKISPDSKMFKLNPAAMFITYEELTPNARDKCGNEFRVLVKPIKQDEYYRIMRNPFRRPRQREALRLNTEDMLEIISTYPSYSYKVRYLRRPQPIILYDEPGLTIEGRDSRTECELPPMVHRLILDRAVQMAVAVYKQPS